MEKERIVYLDILRIISISMVVMIHTSGWFALKIGLCEAGWDTQLMGAISSCAVPVFFMISGALMLSPAYQFSITKILSKVWKIIIIWLLWGIVYALADMDTFSIEKLAIWTFKGHFHFWFLEYLLAIYLLLPVLRAITEYRNGQYVLFFLICWFILGILPYTFNGISWHNEEIRIVTGKIHYELAYFSGYFVLGHYLSKLYIKQNYALSCFCCFCISAVLHYYVLKLSILNIGTYSFTPLIVIEAASLFLLCKTVFSNKKQNDVFIKSLALSTLGIYMIHPIILEHCVPNGIWTLPIGFRVLVLFAYVFVLSGTASYLLNKIPIFRRWMLSI